MSTFPFVQNKVYLDLHRTPPEQQEMISAIHGLPSSLPNKASTQTAAALSARPSGHKVSLVRAAAFQRQASATLHMSYARSAT